MGLSVSLAAKKISWIMEQNRLKQQLICWDSFSWNIPQHFGYESKVEVDSDVNPDEQGVETLRLIGGMDLSFVKGDPDQACAALVVMNISTMQIVYEDFQLARLHMPYIPGFLGFREIPPLLGLLEKLRNSPDAAGKFPQLLMIDGNGILHPRGFGLASHLGVVADIPTVGIAKTLFHVDGLDEHRIRARAKMVLVNSGDAMDLVGESGKVWGSALRSTGDCVNPVYISVGHRVSLRTAVEIVKKCCRFRVPEPVRQADQKSREYLRARGYN